MADIDPRVPGPAGLAPTIHRRGAAAAAALILVLGPVGVQFGRQVLLRASNAPATPDDGSPASGKLRVSNWPLYMADGFVAAFQTATGLVVDYKEDFNDNEEWFAKNKEPLSRRQDIGADVVVPTQFMAARLEGLGWLNPISESRWSNKKNMRPDLLKSRPTTAANTAPRTCRAWWAWPTTARPPAGTSPRWTTCGIRRSRARSACSPTPRTASA